MRWVWGIWTIVLTIGLSASPALAGAGRIKTVAGQVSIQRGPTRVPVVPGAAIEQGDVLVTGRDGRVGVTFSDNSRFAILPNSRVTISEFNYDAARSTGSFVASVNRGKVGMVSGNIARSSRDAMRVRTPTTLLGVRGTRFLVEVR